VRRPALACFATCCWLAPGLIAQEPDTAASLDALARSAAIFSRSAPALTARETLTQRGRRGEMQILKSGPNAELRKIAFTLPDEFKTHEVVSEYSFGRVGDAPGIHEVRHILTMDDEPVTGEARHALNAGTESAEDETKKRLLEELEHTQLLGSAVDFGLMMLMFTKAKQSDFAFIPAGRRTAESPDCGRKRADGVSR
jgi:hypothetical protein